MITTHRLVTLAILLMILALASVVAAHTPAANRVICPPGSKVSTTKVQSGTIVECHKEVRNTHRVYQRYAPCKPPARYVSTDEIPTGRFRGTDRCTLAGVSGPSLPCPVGQKREIVRGRADKCYFLSNQSLEPTNFLICPPRRSCLEPR